jgi:hypothetical protein
MSILIAMSLAPIAGIPVAEQRHRKENTRYIAMSVAFLRLAGDGLELVTATGVSKR